MNEALRDWAEFSGHHNQRPLNTADQMGAMAASMDGKRLPYAVLTHNPPTG